MVFGCVGEEEEGEAACAHCAHTLSHSLTHSHTCQGCCSTGAHGPWPGNKTQTIHDTHDTRKPCSHWLWPSWRTPTNPKSGRHSTTAQRVHAYIHTHTLSSGKRGLEHEQGRTKAGGHKHDRLAAGALCPRTLTLRVIGGTGVRTALPMGYQYELSISTRQGWGCAATAHGVCAPRQPPPVAGDLLIKQSDALHAHGPRGSSGHTTHNHTHTLGQCASMSVCGRHHCHTAHRAAGRLRHQRRTDRCPRSGRGG